MSRQKLSYCRLCMGHCGVVVTVDDDERLLEIRGDHDDSQTLGYACFKGLKATEAHNSAERILQPLKKMPNGQFQAVPLAQALEEIGEKLAHILTGHGPEAIAGYKGGGAFFTSSSSMMLNSFLAAIESPKAFSSVTIDQSAKAIAMGRIGMWPAGRTPFHRGDVFMIVGGNPLVSVSTNGFDTRNPLKRLKQAKARGMQLIVIDPRHTETAKFADLFLQPLPGEDCSILAGLLHIIFANGWEDSEFCARYASQMAELREAVTPFTPDYVAHRAEVPREKLLEVAEVFASRCSNGAATSATGPDMSPHGNLAEHLLECLNVVCGRFVREGQPVDNPGFLASRFPRCAEVIPAPRWWESGYKSRLGDYGLLDGELPTATLADEILQPGNGQVKALLVHGGNPASAIPDQRKIVQALQALELLVTIEPFMTTTAQLSDYILPPTLQYERADLPLFIYESLIVPEPFSRYTAPVAKPPAGAEVVDDWRIFWRLAQRLGVELMHFGVPLNMQCEPETDDLLAIAARNAPVSFTALQAAPRGILLADEQQTVEPGNPDSPHRFTLLPNDVALELHAVLASPINDPAQFGYRLAVRRMRDALNSACRDLPSIKKRLPYNMLYLNPEDMAKERLEESEMLVIRSEHGEIAACAAADPDLRQGVVQITHGFGGLPAATDYRQQGVSTNLLISTDRHCESINAMPRMSGIPVALCKLGLNH